MPASPRVGLIVPPFAGLNRPSLAAHLLQAIARINGFDVEVIYANSRLAAVIGEDIHQKVCYTSASILLGERFFSRRAYGSPPLGRGFDAERASKAGYDLTKLLECEQAAEGWLDEFAASIVDRFDIVGCSTTFEQTAGSIAILAELKKLKPSIITIIGGANCEGPMGDGIASLGNGAVDYVFSGESEETFPKFLLDLQKKNRPLVRIIRGTPCLNLDALPLPSFEEYFDQLKVILPNSTHATLETIWLPYESSRGCWWGEKQHCTFCGINGEGMRFREKNPQRVIDDFTHMAEQYKSKNVCMVDNIMPFHYFETVLPALADRLRGRFHIFYEQKANLTPSKVGALKAAGVNLIQPGIEALSTRLLRLMKKGVSAKQNVNLLRYARSAEMSVNWNLLWGFPQDDLECYTETLELLPLIRHLHPPTGLCALSIERFSPYFFDPHSYGVESIQPVSSYEDVVPPTIDPSTIAYHFTAVYRSGSKENLDIVEHLYQEIMTWRKAWKCDDEVTSATATDGILATQSAAPFLGISAIDASYYLLIDTRGLLDSQPIQFLNETQAQAILKAHPQGCGCEIDWAIQRKLLAFVDKEWIPLVTGDIGFMERFSVTSSCALSRRHLNVLSAAGRHAA